MWLKWLPWKIIAGRLARSHGFTDPIAILSHVRRFSQPSEVNEPIELLRAGVVLHARGLINSRVIQHNLDWVWPYWVNQQFDPKSAAFIPRAFSMTHINLSARNWTAVGIPGRSEYPVVDPDGVVMPFWDGWSIDAWMLSDQGELLSPAHPSRDVRQRLAMDKNLSIITESQSDNHRLVNTVQCRQAAGGMFCCLDLTARSRRPAWLIISLRPYNPEGISFLHKLEFHKDQNRWDVNGKETVLLSDRPNRQVMSDYNKGDVAFTWRTAAVEKTKLTCNVGMATAAAMFRLEPDQTRTIRAAIPLGPKKRPVPSLGDITFDDDSGVWPDVLKGHCALTLPYKNYQYLFDAAVRSVVLHCPDEVYPGPFTYKRFWFRDAAIIVYALLRMGMFGRCEKLIDKFFPKQTALGYFHSQQGEWDSNGQVLWAIGQYCRLSNTKIKDSWLRPVVQGAKWITRKCTPAEPETPTSGLLPAGFSAEHFGPNDFYYWDDFWSVAGLKAAAELLEGTAYETLSRAFRVQADDLLEAIAKSLRHCQRRLHRPAMPISPHRRLDSAAIGSLAASYPLNLFSADSDRVADTAAYLLDNCLVDNAFFHDITHSGINPYLTLHLAQVAMRLGNPKFAGLIERIAELASPTGQWPEAINPRTGLGCMGDGQHVWASAEWILMMLDSFVMQRDGKLVLCAGVSERWLKQDSTIEVGPVATEWGPVHLKLKTGAKRVTVKWDGHWHRQSPEIVIQLPNEDPVSVQEGQDKMEFSRVAQR